MKPMSPEAQQLIDRSRGVGGPSVAQRSAMKHAVITTVMAPPSAMAGKAPAAGAGAQGGAVAFAVKLGVAMSMVAAGAIAWNLAGSGVRPPEAPATQRQVIAPVAPKSVEVHEAAEAPVAVESAVAVPQPRAHEAVPSTGGSMKAAAPRAAPSQETAALPMKEEAPAPEAPRDSAPGHPTASADLSREVAAVSAAMAAVDAKNYEAALELLTAYRSAFPTGALNAEARVVEALALCGLGRADDAQAAARAVPPSTPALRRLKGSCVATDETAR